MKKYILTGIATAVLMAGCAGPMNNTERGAAQGAVLGGILGAVIGHNTKGKKTAEGAAICALGGALLGGAVGNAQDKKEKNDTDNK
jgi:uncharacterized protein YcfJ